MQYINPNVRSREVRVAVEKTLLLLRCLLFVVRLLYSKTHIKQNKTKQNGQRGVLRPYAALLRASYRTAPSACVPFIKGAPVHEEGLFVLSASFRAVTGFRYNFQDGPTQ